MVYRQLPEPDINDVSNVWDILCDVMTWISVRPQVAEEFMKYRPDIASLFYEEEDDPRFGEVWNEAYEIYNETGSQSAALRYLCSTGIYEEDARIMVQDIVETSNL